MDQEIEILENVQQQLRSREFLNADYDVIFEVKGGRFVTHRNLFALSLTYFSQLFTNIKHESGKVEEITVIEDIEPSAFEDIVKYIYCGKIEISFRNVDSLLIGSSILGLNDVRDACANFLIKILKKFVGCQDYMNNTIFQIRFIAIAMNNNDLVNVADQYIGYNLENFMKISSFLDLGFLQLMSLIESDFLIAKTEEVVYKACIQWVGFKEERIIHLPQLLSKVRLNLLSSQLLYEIFYQLPHECQSYVNDAINFQRSQSYPEIFQNSRSRHNDISGQIFVVSGDFFECIQMYNPNTKTWKEEGKPQIQRKRIYMSGSAVQGILYIIGGVTWSQQKQVATVTSFNSITKIWSQCCDTLIARSEAAVAVLGDCIYICGGLNGERVLNEVEKYNPIKNSSMMISPMLSHRKDHCAVVLDGCIYILGGINEMGHSLNSVERFNPNLNRWEVLESMKCKRKLFGAAVLKGKIYACGGELQTGSSKSVEVYCPNKNTWKFIASMTEKRSKLAVVSNMGKLWAIGGQFCNAKLSSVEVYDPEENKWTYSRPMIKARSNHFAVVIP